MGRCADGPPKYLPMRAPDPSPTRRGVTASPHTRSGSLLAALARLSRPWREGSSLLSPTTLYSPLPAGEGPGVRLARGEGAYEPAPTTDITDCLSRSPPIIV